MTISANQPIPHDTDPMTLARLDGENLSCVNTIREYLESHGCRVLENSEANFDCLYHIVVGDSSTVKSILSRKNVTCVRRLVLLISGSQNSATTIAATYDTKVACIPARPINPNDARVIFGFLFRHSDAVMSIDTNLSTDSPKESQNPPSDHLKKEPPTKIETPPINDQQSEDETRIGDFIKGYFVKTKKKKNKNSFAIIFSLFLKYAFLGMFLWILIHIGSFVAGTMILLSFAKNTPSKNSVRLSQTFFHITKATLDPMTSVAVFPLGKPFRVYEQLVDTLVGASDSLERLTTILSTLTPGLFVSGGTQGGDSPVVVMQKIHQELTTIDILLASTEADIARMEQTVSSPFFLQKISSLHGTISHIRDIETTLLHLSVIYPTMAGVTKEQKYLLLFQNTEELRPTGGFIGSIGFLTMKEGKITDTQIEDVYTIDGQLRGHIDPPEPIRTILAQEHWYMRDSNWDPDFVKSAKNASFFLEKSTGTVVDGVIGINLSVVQELLRATGPLKVEGIEEPVTADTVFGILHNEIQQNFFPGSTQKKTALSNLATALMLSLQKGTIDPIKFVAAISKSMTQQELLIQANDETTMGYLDMYKWSGRFFPADPCEGKGADCISDTLGDVEANLSVDKANYYLQRKIKRAVTISENSIETQDEISLQNDSPEVGLGGGDYTVYMRLYYPPHTKIQTISLDTRQIPWKAIPISLPYGEILTDQESLVTVGIAFSVPPKSTRVLKVEAVRPVQQGNTYALSIKRQSGSGNTPFSLVVDSPQKATPIPVFLPSKRETQEFVAKPGHFEYNTPTLHTESITLTYK